MTPDDYPENFIPQVGPFSLDIPVPYGRNRVNLRNLEHLAIQPINPQNTTKRSFVSLGLSCLYIGMSLTKYMRSRDTILNTPPSLPCILYITLKAEGKAQSADQRLPDRQHQ